MRTGRSEQVVLVLVTSLNTKLSCLPGLPDYNELKVHKGVIVTQDVATDISLNANHGPIKFKADGKIATARLKSSTVTQRHAVHSFAHVFLTTKQTSVSKLSWPQDCACS